MNIGNTRGGFQLKRFLLAWTLGPICLFMAIDSVSLYYSTLQTANAAHDRLLQATAQQIGDMLRIEHDNISTSVPLALIEALEGAGGSHMYYRVIGFDGRHVAGDIKLPRPLGRSKTGDMKLSYVAEIDGRAVQVSALYQPIESSHGQGIAIILVGETMEARLASASALLYNMLTFQLSLMVLISVITWMVVERALAPLAALRNELKQRAAESTEPVKTRGPKELQPVVDEMNALFQRQQELLTQQQRLIADASHQLRTPMTVLKTQLQSALSGDAPAPMILTEMLRTVDRTTHLANQLLSKVRLQQQVGAPGDLQTQSLNAVAQEAILEMSPLLAAKHIDCSLDPCGDAVVTGKPWMAGELVRNLLSNAIRHTPARGQLGIRIQAGGGGTTLTVWDTGPGISEGMRAWLFQPFATAEGISGAGLGLSICLDIAKAMNAEIELCNRVSPEGVVEGLDAVVRWVGDRLRE